MKLFFFDSKKKAILLSRLFLTAAFLCPALYWFSAASSTASCKELLWGLAIAFLSSHLFSIRLSLILGGLLTPLVLSMLGYIALNGAPPYPEELLETLIQTNAAETIAAYHFVMVVPGFIIWTAIYGLFFALAIFFAFRGWPAQKRKDSLHNITALALVCFLILVTSVLFKTDISFWTALKTDVQNTVYGEAGLLAFDMILKQETTGPARQPIEVHEKVHISKPILSILVIGESMRADALGPSTTSRGIWSTELNERVEKGLGLWMPHVCAAHDSTYMSVPALITGTPPNIFHLYYNKKIGPYLGAAAGRDLFGFKAGLYVRPTGLSRLESAGFDVGWISSGRQDLFAGPEVRDGKGFLYRSHLDNYFTEAKGPYDEELLSAATNFMAPMTRKSYDGKPMAFVVHLYGNHFAYRNRYPDNLFDPEPAGLSDEQLQNLQYDRASEYTAKVLTEIGHLLDSVSVPAFAIYTSDHGENLMRDHNGLIGHISARTSLAGIMVPFFVMWNSAAGQAGLPQKVLPELVKAKRLAQVDVYNAWMSLSGLDGNDVVHPTETPLVFGTVNAGDVFDSLPCDSLKP